MKLRCKVSVPCNSVDVPLAHLDFKLLRFLSSLLVSTCTEQVNDAIFEEDMNEMVSALCFSCQIVVLNSVFVA